MKVDRGEQKINKIYKNVIVDVKKKKMIEFICLKLELRCGKC